MHRTSGLLLGVGLGGFVDGILLHQILQWHHMLTSTAGNPPTTVAGLEANTLADGFFHAATWVCVAIGIYLLWREGRVGPWRVLLGWMLAGWGAFNLVEGTVDHLILGIHHVRDDLGGPLGWDLGFLAFGAALLLAGLALARSAPRPGSGARPGPARP
jgi:uncharacterized membrane protein